MSFVTDILRASIYVRRYLKYMVTQIKYMVTLDIRMVQKM